MEGRVRKYHRQVSPERAKVWTEKSPKYQQSNRRVPVVYYLCKNRQLEHPHFIEVPVSSPDGLYLRDVIVKLNVLRGRGMASMYSWSCKRSYKNGFVWHDICEDDLILPAQGSEYVLKGSELFEECHSGRFSPAEVTKSKNQRQLPEPAPLRAHDDSSSSSSMNGRDSKHSQDDELSPPVRHTDSSGVSPGYRDGKSSPWNGCLSLAEYKVHKGDGLADASTQTEETVIRTNKVGETCTRGVSTDDGSLEPESTESCENRVPRVEESSDISRESISPPPPSSSTSSSGGKTATLESLIKADARKANSFRILEEEECRMPLNTKLKASNMLMQLISCGSISVKDHSFSLIPTYRPSFPYSKFPSPLFSTSHVMGELDCLIENPRLMGLRLEEKEYFSGSLFEKTMLKEEGDRFIALKRSSSYNADRSSKQYDLAADKEETLVRSKCIPLSIKVSLSKHPRSESMRSPVSEGPRISSDGADSSRTITPSMSDGSSQRITEPSTGKQQSNRLDSFREEKEKVIKIEERLASGARVIIQSTPYETSGNSWD
ncbi:protein SOSEKI 3 [Rhododendron vialii]|uniref:protein SOSEKI 3 n=1 Tax=Rhododendron vialii TaxID=182163 RepID=UPI00265E47E0|nr:protein SOSEKI 3 [Rhododendron vialii]